MTEAAVAAPPRADRREASRFTLLFRAAKLIVDGNEYLCVLRDISARGAKVRLFYPLPVGTDLAIELGNGERYPATVVWCRDNQAGMRLKREIDTRELLDDTRDQYPKRQTRLNFDYPVLLTVQGCAFGAVLRNISQQGACIDCTSYLRIHEPIRIEGKGLPTINGKVCWRGSPRHGVVFERGFSFEELALLTWRLQHMRSYR